LLYRFITYIYFQRITVIHPERLPQPEQFSWKSATDRELIGGR
jgi:hypothetical protein